MSREIVLHIGMTKTGSTSVQHVLNASRPALAAQGICYPATPGETRHIMLATAFTSYPNMLADIDNPLWGGRAPQRAVEDYLASLRAEIETLSAGIDQIVFSSEQFSTHVRQHGDIARLHAFLAPYARRFRIIVYLRRQDEHFASLYSQFLRLGNVRAPDMSHLQPFHHDYDYADVIGRWAAVFGEQAVEPRLFERAPDRPFDVLADFAALCGVDLAAFGDAGAAERNPSMNEAGQATLRTLGELMARERPGRGVGGPVWQRMSEAVTATASGRGWKPTTEQSVAFLGRFADANERVRARWFPGRASLFAPPANDTAPSPVTDEAAYQAACAAFLQAMQQGVKRELRLMLDKARLAERLGDARLRRATLASAIRLDGQEPTARLRLAECLADEGDLEGARRHMTVAAKLRPDAPGLLAIRRRLAGPPKGEGA